MSQTFLEDIPEFLEIQRNSFLRILDTGLIQAFRKINPIVPTSQCKYGLLFYPKEYVLILPETTITEAFLQGKTYGCKIYVPALIYHMESLSNTSTLGVRRFKSLKTLRQKQTKTNNSRFSEETFFGLQESGSNTSTLTVEKRLKVKKGDVSRILSWECFLKMHLTIGSLSKKNKALGNRATSASLKKANSLVTSLSSSVGWSQGSGRPSAEATQSISSIRPSMEWKTSANFGVLGKKVIRLGQLQNFLSINSKNKFLNLLSKLNLVTNPNLSKSVLLNSIDSNYLLDFSSEPYKQILKPTLHYLFRKLSDKNSVLKSSVNLETAQRTIVLSQIRKANPREIKNIYDSRNQPALLDHLLAKQSPRSVHIPNMANKSFSFSNSPLKLAIETLGLKNIKQRSSVLYNTLPKKMRQKSQLSFFQRIPKWLRGRSNTSLIHECLNRYKYEEYDDITVNKKKDYKEWLLPFSKGSLINPKSIKSFDSQASHNTSPNNSGLEMENIHFSSPSLASLSSHAKPLSGKEWVCIGVLPLMTPRGHFIINGSHRIIISQMARAPGLYYQTGDKVQATIVPSKGAWLRLSVKASDNGEIKIWVRITPQRKMPYKIFIETYKHLEISKAVLSKCFTSSIARSGQGGNSYSNHEHKRLAHQVKALQGKQAWGSKFLNLTYKTLNSKIKHLDKHYAVGVVSGQINRTLLNPSSYSLGTLGRKRLNERLSINEKKGYLTSKDISLIKDNLLKLLGQKSSDLSGDDIDHLENRRVRTCGELLQTEIETGMARLKKAIGKQLDEYSNPDSSLFNTFQNTVENRTKKEIKKSSIVYSSSNQQNTNRLYDLGNGSAVYRLKNANNFFWLKSLNKQNCLYTANARKTLHLFKQKKKEPFWKKNTNLFLLKKKLYALLILQKLYSKPNHFVLMSKGILATQTHPKLLYQSKRIGMFLAQARLSKENLTFLNLFKNTNQETVPNWLFYDGKSWPCAQLPILVMKHIALNEDNSKHLKVPEMGKENLCLLETQTSTKKSITYPTQIKIKTNKGILKKNNYLHKKLSSKVNQTNLEFVNLSPSKIIGTKAFAGALREFFGSNPLSQYMDQTNPLAEITHKRRLSSLGPGGVDRASAGIAIRGIHPSHYGRICPIETPEGKNAGLVNSMTMWARVNNEGFLETPYFQVTGGSLMNQTNNLIPPWNFIPTKKESQGALKIVSSDLKITESAFLPSIGLPTRDGSERSFSRSKRDSVHFCGISPMQNISVATSLIPFLEHDDATRALMGSNMQRQAVPLLKAKEPLIRTGLEGKVVGESGHALQAKCSGIISTATRTFIAIDSFDIVCEHGPINKIEKQKDLVLTSFLPNLLKKEVPNSSNKNSLRKQSNFFFSNPHKISLLPTLLGTSQNTIVTLFKKSKFIGNNQNLSFLKNSFFRGRKTYKNSLCFFLAPKPISSVFYSINISIKGVFKEWLSNSRLLASFDINKMETKAQEELLLAPSIIKKKQNKIIVRPIANEKVVEKLCDKKIYYKPKTLNCWRTFLGDLAFTKTEQHKGKEHHNSLKNRQKRPGKKQSQLLTKAFYQHDRSCSPSTVTLFHLTNCKQVPITRIKQKNNLLMAMVGDNRLPWSKGPTITGPSIHRENFKIKRYRKIHDLQQYTRSNQATVCVQRPAVTEGRWVQKGDLIGDCSASKNGILALGQNIVVAYLPMEGFNFEDAIVVSDRLVHEELYTSIHVQRVEFDMDALLKKHIPKKIKVKKQKSAYKTNNQDWITFNNPHLLESEKQNLNPLGIINVGSWVGPGDVLVSKVFPVERKIAPSRHLLAAVFQEKKTKILDTDDTSVRVPKGIHGRVINVKIVGTGKTATLPLVQSCEALSYRKHKSHTLQTSGYAPSACSISVTPQEASPKNDLAMESKAITLDEGKQLQNSQHTTSISTRGHGKTTTSQSTFSLLIEGISIKPSSKTLAPKHLSNLENVIPSGSTADAWLATHEHEELGSTELGLDKRNETLLNDNLQENNNKKEYQGTSSFIFSDATRSLECQPEQLNYPFFETDCLLQLHQNFLRNKETGFLDLDRTARNLKISESLNKKKFAGKKNDLIFFANLTAKEQSRIISSGAQHDPFKINIKKPSQNSLLTNVYPFLVRREFFEELRTYLTPINKIFSTKQSYPFSSFPFPRSRVDVKPTEGPLKQSMGVSSDHEENLAINDRSTSTSTQNKTINYKGKGKENQSQRHERNDKEENSFSKEKTFNFNFNESKSLNSGKKDKSQDIQKEKNSNNLTKSSVLSNFKPKQLERSKELINNNLHQFLKIKENIYKKSINSQEYKITGVRIYIAERKKLQVGDKMSGRHGNKGIVSTILPREDMPYLPDGTPVDMVLNPLGIPSRMNVGQVFECLLGLAASVCGESIGHTPFDEMYGPEASRSLVYLFLYVSRLRTHADWLFQPNFPGKTVLFDGRTGTPFEQWVTVGRAYMLKLIHMVDEKIHARSIGPRSLVTQQPVKGRARGGGQRLGEMEVWALEGFGAAYTLQEILTIKSDDIKGREEVESSIISATALSVHIPETFRITLFELRCLCLNLELNQNF